VVAKGRFASIEKMGEVCFVLGKTIYLWENCCQAKRNVGEPIKIMRQP